MRISKVVTKVGDGGTTRTVGNEEISKDHPRIHATGDADELNACLGLVVAALDTSTTLKESDQRLLRTRIQALQQGLFDLGADLATPAAKRWQGFRLVTAQKIAGIVKRWIAGRIATAGL